MKSFKIKIIFLLNIYLIFILNSSAFSDQYEIIFDSNLLNEVPLLNSDGTYNAIIEIPSGSNKKWKINKNGKILQREFNDGKPRVINYIGYPGNYGFFPQTLSDKFEGGDGDPTDVLVIGNTLDKGSILRVKIIGMLNVIDNNEVDNKIIAVLKDSEFSKNIKTLDTFRNNHSGILEIIKIWFENYKGYKLEVSGYSEKKTAKEFILKTHKNYLENE
jgi:inorganic pyrophosphatase